MTEEQVVSSTEQTSTTETASTEGEKSQEGDATPQPLTEEKVQQMIAEATAKAVGEAKDAGRKELQSQQDRNIAALSKADRRAKTAEGTLGSAGVLLKESDPEAFKDLQIEELTARVKEHTTLDQEQEAQNQQTAYGQALHDSLIAHLDALGIDSKDERLDWAADATGLVQGRSRFDSSIAKIIKGNQQTMQSGFDERLRAIESKVEGSNIEANSVNTGASQGAISGSDAEFIKKFGSGDVPMTQESMKRYEKITKQY